MNTNTSNLEKLVNQPYKYGFATEIETDTIKIGLSEETVRLISSKKNEPSFMLDFRLKALKNGRR
jgi:Fe-S cluster assembly protein SufB